MKKVAIVIALLAVLVGCCFAAYRMGHQTIEYTETTYLVPYYTENTDSKEIDTAVSKDDNKSFLESEGIDLSSVKRIDVSYPIEDMQVIARAKKLGISETTIETPELAWKTIYQTVHEAFDKREGTQASEQVFSGIKSSELNEFLRAHEGDSVRVSSTLVELDQTISVPANTQLAGDQTKLVRSGELLDKAIMLDGVSNATVRGFSIQGPCNYGIFVCNSTGVRLSSNIVTGMSERGIAIIGENSELLIDSNELVDNVHGGLILNGDIHEGVIERNVMSGATSESNHHAGMVFSSVEVKDPHTAENPYTDVHIYEQLEAPHDIVVVSNDIRYNYAQGVYLYGAYRDYFVGNKLHGNDLEGVCLDFGTVGCYLAHNEMSENGRRAHVGTDETWFLKVPGISLDNAAYNLIAHNNVYGNAGSGIKAVRSAARNQIVANEVHDNNAGTSDRGIFFGIELASDLNPDVEGVTGYDFMPCYENLVAHNNIVGAHYCGLLIGASSANNVYIENTIWGVTKAAIIDLDKDDNDILIGMDYTTVYM